MLGVEDIMSIEKTKINRKEITNCITISAISYLVHKRVSCFREIGLKEWGRRRADIVGISMKSKKITIIEVKSCLADFKADKKYEEYLAYCNIFYIAVPSGSDWINEYKDGLKAIGIGIMELTKCGTIKVKVGAKQRTMKKKIKYEMLIRLAWRSGTYSLRTHLRRKMATTASGMNYQDLVSRNLLPNNK